MIKITVFLNIPEYKNNNESNVMKILVIFLIYIMYIHHDYF